MSHTQHTPNVKKKVCRVHSIYDGDTVTIEWEKESWLGFKKEIRLLKVRLAYINTPEIRYKEPGALRAKEFLEKLIYGKRVIVEYEELPNGRPRTGDYNRILAVLHLERAFLPNININQLLLQKGLARLYKKPDNITPHHCNNLKKAEHSAQKHKTGIWRYHDKQEKQKKQERQWEHDILAYVIIGIIIGIIISLALS